MQTKKFQQYIEPMIESTVNKLKNGLPSSNQSQDSSSSHDLQLSPPQKKKKTSDDETDKFPSKKIKTLEKTQES